MSTPKHTPGPIHNGRPCTCCILLRTGEPLESVHGDQPCSDISRIELCPKHAAAPAMYEALKFLTSEIDLSKLNVRKDFSLMNAHAWAIKVILQAEGKLL